jgi:opacity protein-like surface antigen
MPGNAKEVTMRASTLTALIVLLSLSSATAVATTDAPYAFTAFGGMATPTGDLSTYWGSGLSFGGSLSYQTHDYLAIELAAANGQRFGLDESSFYEDLGVEPTLGSISGASVNAFSVTGGLRVGKSNATINPYGAFGAGYYRLSIADVTVEGFGLFSQTIPGATRNAFGVNLGGGVQSPVSPSMSVFAELRYHVAFTEGTSATYLPVTGGVRIHW